MHSHLEFETATNGEADCADLRCGTCSSELLRSYGTQLRGQGEGMKRKESVRAGNFFVTLDKSR
eukprot:6175993-Pleurochrysis_carterae.AAC.2